MDSYDRFQQQVPRIAAIRDTGHTQKGDSGRTARNRRVAIFERFNAGMDRTLWYYAEVTKSFMTHHRQAASRELDRVVAALLAQTRPSASAELQHLRERPPFMPDGA